MYRIQASIEGIAPIMFNKPIADEIENPNPKRDRTKEEKVAEAHGRYYKNGHGIFLPSHILKQSLLRGCYMANQKRGKRNLYPYVEAGVFFEHMEMPFGQEEPDFIDERWGRRPPKTGGAMIIRRPAFNIGWHIGCSMLVFDDLITTEQLRISLETAGMHGMASGRPEYGRFRVATWEPEAK